MAKQKSIIKLEGTLGDITFVRTKDGYQAREKTSVDANRIATDPVFSRTRENNAEFGRAGKAGKLLRTAFREELQNCSDNRMVSRLTQAMMEVLKADTSNPRGLRTIAGGNPASLEGFEFNINGKLGASLYAPYTTTINRTSGTLQVDFGAFVPTQEIVAPPGTTHFRIKCAAAEVDFEAGKFTADHNESGSLAWNNTSSAEISLINNVPVNSTLPLFLVLGVEFMQEVNTVEYALKNGRFNSLCLIKVSKP